MKTFLILLTLAASALAGEFRVGVAAVPVTPPQVMPMAGYYNTRLAEGTHDDLFAKAIVFEQDGAQAAMVALDLVSIGRPVVEEARKLIEQDTGIPGAHVMISATHSHTGPLLNYGSSRMEAQGGNLPVAVNYLKELPARIAASVKQAQVKLAAAKVSAGVGREERLSFNRRFHMKDGTVGWNAGKLNPNIVKPAGPIDPAVPVVYLETPKGQSIATYVNFAMHLDTVGGLQFSADYPYTLAALLARVKGPDMLTIFTIGTAGDINHIDVSTREPQKGHGEAARIGTILAAEVLRTYWKMQPLTAGPPRVRSEIVKLPLPKLEPGDVEKAATLARRYGGKDEPKFLEKVFAFKVLDVAAREGKPHDAEVQVIALGNDIAWVALPGEIFVELGMAIKEASPFKHTIVVELANGLVGYVPTKRAWSQGNYEVVSARVAEGSGEMLVESAVKLLQELKPKQTANP
ncbi:MAG: hypothetical protein AB1705_15125 [Verrucomicrobiota bacterium]